MGLVALLHPIGQACLALLMIAQTETLVLAAENPTRPAVNPFLNEERFPPVPAKFLRFNIRKANSRRPSIDELEIYSSKEPRRNVGAASAGATFKSNGFLNSSPKFDPSHIGDGLYGRDHRWIADQTTNVWVEVQLAETTTIDRVVWSRDRQEQSWHQTPIDYEIQVADVARRWSTIASSANRRPGLQFTSLPVPAPRARQASLQASPIHSPPDKYIIDSWSSKNGLQLNQTRALAQTEDGYLWLGTDEGLLRFDGNHFVPYNLNTTSVLTTPRVDYLYIDRTGRMWMTNQKFFYDANNNLVICENGKFSRIELPKGHKCNQVFEQEDGTIWIHTDRGALPWIDGKLDTAQLLSKFNLRTLQYQQVQGDSQRATIWDGAPGSWSHGEFVPLYGKRGIPWVPDPKTHVRQLARRDGGSWLLLKKITDSPSTAYRNWGLLRSDGTIPQVTAFPWNLGATMHTGPIVDRSDNLWLAIEGLGLFCFYADGKSYDQIKGTEEFIFRRIFADRDGSIWFTTRNHGLKRLRKRWIHRIGSAQGMQALEAGGYPDNVYSVSPTNEGGVWIGTHSGGGYHWKDGRLSHLLNSFTSSWSIFEDRTGNVWTGAYGKGVRRHDQDRILTLPTASRHPFSFLEDSRGRLWMGGDFGLNYLEDGKLHRFVPPSFDTDRFDWVISIQESAAGGVWIGTKLGFLHHFKDGLFTTHWTPEVGHEFPMCALYRDPDGGLWTARFGAGLTRFQNGEISHFTRTEGLPTETINGILKDRDGFLWFTSKAGVYRLSEQDFQQFAQGTSQQVRWQQFTVKDGLPSNHCQGEQNQPSLCQTEDGRIWIPTLQGIGVLNPTELKNAQRIPQVVFEEVTLHAHDQRREKLLYETTFRQSTNSRPISLSIPPGNRSLKIRYTAIDFTEPEKVNFHYRIKGQDEAWINAKNERAVLINDLAQGEYVFELKATNHHAQEGNVASLRLSVRPYWWETLGFRWALGLGILTLGIAAYRKRVRELERRHQAQADFSRLLIDREEAERIRISRELHDSLGHDLLLVRNRALEGSNQADTTALQQQFQSISEMLGDALENTRRMAYNLRPFELDRIGFKKAVETMISKISETSNTRFFKEVDDLSGVLPAKSQVYLYRLLQEGLNNILKHAHATVVMLELKVEPHRVTVQLEDNGVGFDRETPSGGLGLGGMRERAKLMGANLTITSTPGEGTQIRIEIPT